MPVATEGGKYTMSQHSQHHKWDLWPGWSTISASAENSPTVWFTGLPGVGKTILAQLVKKSLLGRGYKAEIIDAQTLSYWLKQELHIDEEVLEHQNAASYDAFITYVCVLLARNGVITITASISPDQGARQHAREHISNFIEVYLHCPSEERTKRLQQQQMLHTSIDEQSYQPPISPELSIDTCTEPPERSALRIIAYLEQHGHIAPLWEDSDNDTDDEIDKVRARLQALGYLE
jgi:adenylylsulfate kinase